MLLAEELATDERTEDATDELTSEDRAEDELAAMLLEELLLDEEGADELPTIPKGAGCALQVEGDTQLLPFS
jgi:hypothetical protein